MTHPRAKPFLMGAETEFAASGILNGNWIDPDTVYDRLAAGLKSNRAWVVDHHGYRGMYLQHGGRLYLDYGAHPEHATPECHTPRQVALYDKAGEHLLRVAAEAAMRNDPKLMVRIVKNNLDPVDPDNTTYGTHESYTSWSPNHVVSPQLIPHLVSRVLYCGSGGLTGHSAGMGFELSQRARHLREVEGDDTTCDRAIFSTRVRKRTDGGPQWVRIHLIGKDSQRAPFGIYLTYAATGLLIEMMNRGHTVGRGLKLADPVSALRIFSLDPWGKAKARLADGRTLSAVQIQSAYLEECEKVLQTGALPEWAGEAIGHWRDTLAAIERDPLQLADRLDAYCKLLVYERELKRGNLDWSDLKRAMEKLTSVQDYFGSRVSRAIIEDSDANLSAEEKPFFAEARNRLNIGGPAVLDGMRFALKMRALDVKYHEVGGLYDQLHAAGVLRDVILTPAEIDEASRTPPAGGRAAIRGSWISQHPGEDWRADWHFVFQTSTGTCVDLRDPFSGAEKPVRLTFPPNSKPWEIDIVDLLRQPTTVPA